MLLPLALVGLVAACRGQHLRGHDDACKVESFGLLCDELTAFAGKDHFHPWLVKGQDVFFSEHDGVKVLRCVERIDRHIGERSIGIL